MVNTRKSVSSYDRAAKAARRINRGEGRRLCVIVPTAVLKECDGTLMDIASAFGMNPIVQRRCGRQSDRRRDRKCAGKCEAPPETSSSVHESPF